MLAILFVFSHFPFFVFAEVNENVANTQLDLVDTGAVARLLCVLQTSDAMIRSSAMEVFHTMSVLEVRNAKKNTKFRSASHLYVCALTQRSLPS